MTATSRGAETFSGLCSSLTCFCFLGDTIVSALDYKRSVGLWHSVCAVSLQIFEILTISETTRPQMKYIDAI